MKLLLTILACLVAASAGAQTIKSLGYNTTNGNIVAATNVIFTNSVGFSTNARAATRTNLGATTLGNSVFTATNIGAAQIAIFGTNVTINNSAGVEGISLSDGQTKLLSAISFPFLGGATAAATSRTNLGLGTTNDVSFSRLSLSNGATNNLAVTLGATNRGFSATSGPDRITTTVAGISAFSVFSNSIETGPGVAATFATNVSIAGSLTVGSFTTTTPSTWALDATQTAAATNGLLTLPDNANVLRLTNANTISSVTNGRLGAFYYLVNQATNAVTISNVGGITIDGAQNLTLSPNESATLIATGATNVSVANRGDLTDVALGGTANTAPSQTASSGSSLMTRELSDARYTTSVWITQFSDNQTITNAGFQLLAPGRFNAWSFGYGASVPSGFTQFRVVLGFGWLQNPATNSTNFPVFVQFENKGAASTSTTESEHGAAFSRVNLYPTNAASTGLPGTLTRRAVFNTTNTAYSFISDWVTIPSAWQSNAASNGFYHVIGAAIANNTGASVTDGYNASHPAVGFIEFRR